MLPLHDSTRELTDTTELRARLRSDGYVFLRGVVPPEDVLRVRRAVVSVLEQEDWTAAGTDADDLIPGPRACLEAAEGYFDAYARILGLQEFNELAHHPAILDVMARLVNGPLLVHPRKIARASQPHTSEYTLPHQDFRLVQGTVDALTLWMPLGEAPTALGGLRVLSGSAAGGLLPVKPAKGPGGIAIDGRVDGDGGWATTDYDVGDVIIFHSLTVHGAMPNKTDHMRLSADFRYQSCTEPVHVASLRPHYYGGHPDVPGWNVLTQGWTRRDAIATPDALQPTNDFHDPLDPAMPTPRPALVDIG